MRLVTNYAPLYDHLGEAFEGAVDDTLAAARERAQTIFRNSTGKFARTLRRTPIYSVSGGIRAARIGSPLSSANVKEKGGFITAKRRGTLFIPHPDGTLRRPQAVRVPATPVVTVVGPQFIAFMTERLRRTPIRGSGQLARFGKADFRSGTVRF